MILSDIAFVEQIYTKIFGGDTQLDEDKNK